MESSTDQQLKDDSTKLASVKVTTSANDAITTLENLSNSSKCYLANGLTADESGDVKNSVKHYLEASKCLERGIDMNLQKLTGKDLAKAEDTKKKMRSLLQQVRSRLQKLQRTDDDEAYAKSSVNCLPTAPSEYEIFQSRRQSIQDLTAETAYEILHIPGGVQLFAIDEKLEVNPPPPSYPTALSIYTFGKSNETPHDQRRPAGFVQVGDWVYPLVPGQSPVLLNANGAYIFPNVTAENSNSRSVGVVLSSRLDPEYEEVFRHFLTTMASLQEQQQRLDGEPAVDLRDSVPCGPEGRKPVEPEPVPPPQSTSDKVVARIEEGASWFSGELSKGASLTSWAIQKGATRLRRRLKPNEQPSQVNPKVKKGLYYSNQASKATVFVSGVMVKGLCILASGIAQELSPHLKKALPEPESTNGTSSKTRGVLNVANAGIVGFGTVWTGLEEAGMAVALSVTKATVDTVQHKYGEEAGRSASDALGTAVNSARTLHHLNNLGLKAMVKRTAKSTGKEVLQDYGKKLTSHISYADEKSTSKEVLQETGYITAPSSSSSESFQEVEVDKKTK